LKAQSYPPLWSYNIETAYTDLLINTRAYGKLDERWFIVRWPAGSSPGDYKMETQEMRKCLAQKSNYTSQALRAV